MNKKLIKEIILERNKKALFLKEIFDDALIGTGILCGNKHIAAYDSDKCIDILMKTENIGELEAFEQFQITSEKTLPSKNKPVFISDFRNAKEPPPIDKTMEDIDINKTLEDII